jgi:hypothetical protein
MTRGLARKIVLPTLVGMSDFVATYSILFGNPAAAADLTPERLEGRLVEDLSNMSMLFQDYPEDGMEGVQPGDVQVLEVRDIDPLRREYDVRHQVEFETPGPAGMEPLERFGRYLNEALGVPQTETIVWRIDELTVMSVEGSEESAFAAAG